MVEFEPAAGETSLGLSQRERIRITQRSNSGGRLPRPLASSVGPSFRKGGVTPHPTPPSQPTGVHERSSEGPLGAVSASFGAVTTRVCFEPGAAHKHITGMPGAHLLPVPDFTRRLPATHPIDSESDRSPGVCRGRYCFARRDPLPGGDVHIGHFGLAW
jgi:hypothetical protein